MCTRAIGEGPAVTSLRQSCSVWDPASSSAALPESGETHARVMRETADGPVISAHRFCAAHSPLKPSCMVDIIFSSSFLGDMGDHSKSKSIKLLPGFFFFFC